MVFVDLLTEGNDLHTLKYLMWQLTELITGLPELPCLCILG